jgi:magnesium chelatase family protein
MDRIDLFIEVPAVEYRELVSKEKEGQSQNIRQRVEMARSVQRERFKQDPISTNSQMSLPQLKEHCPVPDSSKQLLRKYIDSGKLTARGYHRVLRTARTIADLENSSEIKNDHLSEAIMYRIRHQLSE